MYINYNRSGQHDDDKDEWGSERELRRWSRAAKWNPNNAGSIICFTSSMIYSIAVLDICNFEAIGHKMPNGTGVDATLDNDAVVGKHRKRKHNVKSANNTENIIKEFEHSKVREDKRYALRMLLKFGTPKEKAKAQKELNVLAFGKTDAESDTDTASIDVDDSESDTE
jgi:hypothetical protein